MTSDEILSTLKNKKPELKKFGVKSLSLFGSYARGEQKSSSDIDFLVEFEKKTFDAYMGLKEYLETLFGCRVDLVMPETLKPRLREKIFSELLNAA